MPKKKTKKPKPRNPVAVAMAKRYAGTGAAGQHQPSKKSRHRVERRQRKQRGYADENPSLRLLDTVIREDGGHQHLLDRISERLVPVSNKKKRRFILVHRLFRECYKLRHKSLGGALLSGRVAVQFGGEPGGRGDYLVAEFENGFYRNPITVLVGMGPGGLPVVQGKRLVKNAVSHCRAFPEMPKWNPRSSYSYTLLVAHRSGKRGGLMGLPGTDEMTFKRHYDRSLGRYEDKKITMARVGEAILLERRYGSGADVMLLDDQGNELDPEPFVDVYRDVSHKYGRGWSSATVLRNPRQSDVGGFVSASAFETRQKWQPDWRKIQQQAAFWLEAVPKYEGDTTLVARWLRSDRNMAAAVGEWGAVYDTATDAIYFPTLEQAEDFLAVIETDAYGKRRSTGLAAEPIGVYWIDKPNDWEGPSAWDMNTRSWVPAQGVVRAATQTKKNPRSRRNPRQSDVGMYQSILAHLRALQWVYTTSHWTSAGPNSYSDHLLLQRLYEGLDKPIDALGERMVAYFGPQAVAPRDINKRVNELLVICEERGLGGLDCLYNLEDWLQTSIRMAWKANQDSGDEFSLGIDDYLMGLANERDEAIYLLKQRLG